MLNKRQVKRPPQTLITLMKKSQAKQEVIEIDSDSEQPVACISVVDLLHKKDLTDGCLPDIRLQASQKISQQLPKQQQKQQEKLSSQTQKIKTEEEGEPVIKKKVCPDRVQKPLHQDDLTKKEQQELLNILSQEDEERKSESPIQRQEIQVESQKEKPSHSEMVRLYRKVITEQNIAFAMSEKPVYQANTTNFVIEFFWTDAISTQIYDYMEVFAEEPVGFAQRLVQAAKEVIATEIDKYTVFGGMVVDKDVEIAVPRYVVILRTIQRVGRCYNKIRTVSFDNIFPIQTRILPAKPYLEATEGDSKLLWEKVFRDEGYQFPRFHYEQADLQVRIAKEQGIANVEVNRSQLLKKANLWMKELKKTTDIISGHQKVYQWYLENIDMGGYILDIISNYMPNFDRSQWLATQAKTTRIMNKATSIFNYGGDHKAQQLSDEKALDLINSEKKRVKYSIPEYFMKKLRESWESQEIEQCLDCTVVELTAEMEVCHKHQNQWTRIYAWIKRVTTSDSDERNPCLVGYSQKRAIGKTTFFQSLASPIDKNGSPTNPEKFISVAGNFAPGQLDEIGDAEILILDDFYWNIKDMVGGQSASSEMFKRLLTSQGTTIRAAYLNQTYKGGLPVVILTNSPFVYKFFGFNQVFANEVYPVEITEPLCEPELVEKHQNKLAAQWLPYEDEKAQIISLWKFIAGKTPLDTEISLEFFLASAKPKHPEFWDGETFLANKFGKEELRKIIEECKIIQKNAPASEKDHDKKWQKAKFLSLKPYSESQEQQVEKNRYFTEEIRPFEHYGGDPVLRVFTIRKDEQQFLEQCYKTVMNNPANKKLDPIALRRQVVEEYKFRRNVDISLKPSAEKKNKPSYLNQYFDD